MIGFNDTSTMMAFMRAKKPQGLAAVKFATSVGVAPGTATLQFDGAKDCPPDSAYRYMTPSGLPALATAPTPRDVVDAAAKTVVQEYNPYGSEVELNGIGPFGVPWTRIMYVGVGIAALAWIAHVARVSKQSYEPYDVVE